MPDQAPWRLIRSLREKKKREETGLTVAEGPPSVALAEESGVRAKWLVLSHSYAQTEPNLALGPSWAERTFVVDDELFGRMSQTGTPQGVLCVLPFPFVFDGPRAQPIWREPLVVVGLDIQDPGNVGTLVRAGAGAGASQVVFLGASADPYSPKCIRASAGTVFCVSISHLADRVVPVDYVAELSSSGISLYKAAPQGGALPWDADFVGPSAILLGNEAQGLPSEILEGPGTKVTIPMPGGTESLNVAVASGALLYEATRQRLGSSSVPKVL